MAIKVSGTEVISDDKRILNNESLPDIRPSLLLDFANSKTLDPRITFTRGSTATYWDGKTTAKAEENLYPYSQQVDQWPDKTNVTVTADNTTAPDGTTTADRITDSGSGDIAHYALTPLSIETSVTYSISCYVKYGSGNGWVLIGFTGGTYAAYFDVQNGTVGTVGGSASGASITDVGNGWYRCELQTIMSSSPAYPQVRLAPSDGTATYTADGSYVWAWGFQVEKRSSVTAYTATTSSPIVKYQPVLQTAASGEARFDHDPVTGESKGLLIEEARTNLFPYDNPSASAWYKNESTITANALTAPDGTTTASKLVENTANAVHYTSETITVSGDTRYTMSVFAKAGEKNFLKLQCGFVSNWVLAHDIIFDLSDGSLHDSSSAESVEGTDFGSYDMGNGWYRLWISGTTISSATAAGFNLHLATGVGNQVLYTGDGYSGVFVWGAQMEEGSFPTSYIPTSGSTVTRARDETTTALSNWFRPDEGSFYTEYEVLGNDNRDHAWYVEDNGNSRLALRAIDGTRASYVVGNSLANRTIYFDIVPYEYYKTAMAYSQTEFSATIDGATTANETEGYFYGGNTTFWIGGGPSSGNQMNGHIIKIAYYPKRLPNATLTAMTEA
jgi:hypothetical protein